MIIDTPDSTGFTMVISEPDQGEKLYNVEEYYFNKKLKLSGKSSTKFPVNFEGPVTSFYPNGRRKETIFYRSAMQDGDAYYFYPSGKTHLVKEFHSAPNIDSTIKAVYDTSGKVLAENGEGLFVQYDETGKKLIESGTLKKGKQDGEWTGVNETLNIAYKEVYQNGELLNGVATDDKGRSYNYKERYEKGEFPGGLDAFGRFLGRNIQYPETAKKDNTQGRVIVKFEINKDGSVGLVEILRSVRQDLDNEAIRVIRSMPNFSPFKSQGIPVKGLYTVPISFSIHDSSSRF